MNESQKYNIIKLVAEGKRSKRRASVQLSITIRQVNRLLNQYLEKGKSAFVHGNRNRVSNRAVPEKTRANIIKLYLSYHVSPNVKHFTQILAEQHGIVYSDTTIRKLLYKEGILSPKSQRKTRRKMAARLKAKQKNGKEQNSVLPTATERIAQSESIHPSRPRKKYQGELIQMDASSYNWFGDEITHLHLAIDDASGNIVGAYFDRQETLNGYYHVLHQLLTKHGIPVAFLTDKRTVFEYRAKARKQVEEDTFTQFGFACHQLGIEIKTTSVAQAKGRVERLHATLQSRLPVDLEIAGVSTIEQANQFLVRWIGSFNRTFGNKTQKTVFEKAPTPSQLNLLLARVAQRTVDSGHHIRFMNHFYLPIDKNGDLYFTRGVKVLVIEAFDGEIYVSIEEQLYETRRLLEHERFSQEMDPLPELKKERRKYIPPQSHPWKLASFKQYLRSVGKTLEEYEAEKTA